MASDPSTCAKKTLCTSAPSRVGVVTSTFYLFLDLDSGIGPILLGYVVTGFGFPAMFLVAAAVTVLSGLLYVYVHGRRPSARGAH